MASAASSSVNFDDTQLKQTLKQLWGFSDFRPGQLETIKRVLKRQSTLLTVPTGGGKSICYQLPAYLMGENGGLTLVVRFGFIYYFFA